MTTLPASADLGQISALMIDLDGTLVDTGPDFQVAINAMRRELGLGGELDIATITKLVGKGSDMLVRGVLAREMDASQVDALAADALSTYLRHYSAINGRYSLLYPFVREGLHALQEMGLQLACVTNKPHDLAVDLLAHFELDGYFSLVYGGDSFPRKKPDPMALLAACQHYGLAPAQVLMLGDSSNDAQAARAAGCPVWILPYGYNHGESVHNIQCDGIVATLFDAAEQLANSKLLKTPVPAA